MSDRPYILAETDYFSLRDYQPALAVLPWGATEAHGRHLPHGTDVYESQGIAELAAEQAHHDGARLVVLPAIPFGNDEQQLDQAATVSFRTATAAAVLDDVCRSLTRQGIDRLLIVNGHGGNAFQPLVRDASAEHRILIVVAEFWKMAPAVYDEVFEQSGDHADEMETSVMLHLHPDLVDPDRAGEGKRVPFDLRSLNQPGVWTPRPWSASHPDTGSGDPRRATAEKGKRFVEAVTKALAEMMVELAWAQKGQLPYR